MFEIGYLEAKVSDMYDFFLNYYASKMYMKVISNRGLQQVKCIRLKG